MTDWAVELMIRLKKNNISWSEVAQKMGVTPQYISQLTHGIGASENAKEKLSSAVDLLVAQRVTADEAG